LDPSRGERDRVDADDDRRRAGIEALRQLGELRRGAAPISERTIRAASAADRAELERRALRGLVRE